MLNDRFQIINGFVDLRFDRLALIHFFVQGIHFLGIPLRQRFDPSVEKLFFHLLMGLSLVKGWNISGKTLPQIVDDEHLDHLVHISLGKLIPHEKGHQGRHPQMLRYAFMPALGGIAVPGRIFQSLGDPKDVQQFSCFHIKLLLYTKKPP